LSGRRSIEKDTTSGHLRAPAGGQVVSPLLGGNPQHNATVEGHAFELDVEALAVLMSPGRADTGPERLLAFAVAYLIGDVARRFAGGGFVSARVSHGLSPSFR
jgi:hypothetical protein